MYLAIHNLSDVNGNLIASGSKDLKPEILGDKTILARYLELGAIQKMTADDAPQENPQSVIVTGEVQPESRAAEMAAKAAGADKTRSGK